MVDWSYHLGVFLSLSALFFFHPVGFETFLRSSVGFLLEHKCTQSTLSLASFETALIKQLLACTWGECVWVCPLLPAYFPIMYLCVMHRGDCVANLCQWASVHMFTCVCTCFICTSCLNLYARTWPFVGLCVCVCVCALTPQAHVVWEKSTSSLKCIWRCSVLSLSLIYGVLLHILQDSWLCE